MGQFNQFLAEMQQVKVFHVAIIGYRENENINSLGSKVNAVHVVGAWHFDRPMSRLLLARVKG